MQFSNHKKLGRPSNHNPLRFYRYRNDDLSEDFYQIVPDKNKLKREYLFRKYPNRTCSTNQDKTNDISTEIQNQNQITLQTNYNQNQTVELPHQNINKIYTNNVNSDFNPNDNKNKETDVKEEIIINDDSLRKNEEKKNTDVRNEHFNNFSIENLSNLFNNNENNFDFDCYLDTDDNFPLSGFKNDDFDIL